MTTVSIWSYALLTLLLVVRGFPQTHAGVISRSDSNLSKSAADDAFSQEGCCQPSDPKCWPTAVDIAQLAEDLDERSMERKLVNVEGEAMHGPVSRLSDEFLTALGITGLSDGRADSIFHPESFLQPFYGRAASGMRAVYVRNWQEMEYPCRYTSTGISDFCCMASRTFPYDEARPQIVVFPMTPKHVQKTVAFATKHNLCISVAGMGHDYLNRNANGNSLFIRTTLMKDMEFDLEDRRGYGWKEGNVKLGAGVNWHEIYKASEKYERMVSGGACPSVGVVGFTVGGGMGRIAASKGLGADNLLEAEVVLADGTVAVANETHHSDLWWALRGGGGGTWGIITSVTLRLHKAPKLGFGGASFWLVTDKVCNNTPAEMVRQIIDPIVNWTRDFTKDTYVTWHLDYNESVENNDGLSCAKFMFSGFLMHSLEDMSTLPHFQTKVQQLSSLPLGPEDYGRAVSVSHIGVVADASSGDLLPTAEHESPYQNYSDYKLLQGALVSTEDAYNGKLTDFLVQDTLKCVALVAANKTCEENGSGLNYVRGDLTGWPGSPQAKNVSFNPVFRNARFNVISANPNVLKLSEACYANESNINTPNWQKRYWGENYERLLEVKKKYDCHNLFWCRHCVGSESKYKRTVGKSNVPSCPK